MTHAAATAYPEAATSSQSFSGRPLPRAGHVLAAHASQAEAQPRTQRRIDRQDDREQLRWLVPPRRLFGFG
jgi:hypothetical protein